MSTGTNIERITENNGIINDNNADLLALKNRIDNLPDTSTATAQSKDILQGKTAFVNGNEVTGTCDWENIKWTPQLDWWDIKTIIEEDEEDYPCKVICLLQDIYDIDTISRLGASKIVTSDGVEYDTSSTSYTHTWDKTKDRECSLGYKTRYIIYYFSSSAINSYNSYVPITTLYIVAKNINTNQNFNSFATRTICESIELINCKFGGNFLFFYNNYRMKKITGVQSNASNLTASGTGTFMNDNNLKELGLICNNTVAYDLRHTFNGNDILFYNECFDMESLGINSKLVTRYWQPFPPRIKSIKEINFDNVANNVEAIRYAFSNLVCLIEIKKIGTINKNGFNFSACVLLNHDTLIRILNALYDYSESEDTYTLTIGNDNLNKLTNEEKAIATRKRLDTGIGGKK